MDHIERYIWALFIQDHDHINKYCLVNSKLRQANKAVCLDEWLWTVSPLVVEKIQIRHLTDTHAVHITPHLQI